MTENKTIILSLFQSLCKVIPEPFNQEIQKALFDDILLLTDNKDIHPDIFGFNPIVFSFETAKIVMEEMGLKQESVIATLLFIGVVHHVYSLEDIEKKYGEQVSRIMKGLIKIHELYQRTPVVESENFRNLLLSFAEDMRVILIMIANRINIMREIKETKELAMKQQIAEEANYLYAPLAHKLGLYKIKSELEDLSLKYLEHDAYYHIKEKLNATKNVRNLYIQQFIEPIKKKLEQAGLSFHIKGRTKSIHSIWQKMQKQKCKFEGIYDLFAIRIILNAPEEKEKMQCWQAYSIITDMYQPNPKRLRDWLSVPKSNGYESLHITVLGPENKWVEVQIRTERMDEIAEKGLAAHWRYKGVKSANGIDEWLNNIRTALESNNDMQLMDQFKLGLYEDEIYVFSPKGDLYGLYAKEVLERRFKNKKIELEENILYTLIKRMGFKVVSDFYKQIAEEKLDCNEIIEKYLEIKEHITNNSSSVISAEEFNFERPINATHKEVDDILIIDKDLKGIDFTLAKCCNPIYGDDVFGFVTVSGGIKIHRKDCPNSLEMRRKFGYRIVKAQWSGKGTSLYNTTLRITGNDDISIINNITSIISKEDKIALRAINIESNDGLFIGNLTLQLQDTTKLSGLIKKIQTIKGVKQIVRI